MNAGLALDGLEEHRSDAGALLGEDVTQGVNVVGIDADEATRQRAERVLSPALHRRGNGLHRTAVEALVEADDVKAAVAATLRPEASEFDGALVGLGTRVAKEGAPLLRRVGARVLRRGHTGIRKLGDAARDLSPVLDLEVVRDVQELVDLLLDGTRERGMAVAQTVHGDASEEVEILLAV